MRGSLPGSCAIAGIGQTEFSKESGRSELQLACEAVSAALDDAGLAPADVDGMVTFTMDSSDEIDVARKALGRHPYDYVIDAQGLLKSVAVTRGTDPAWTPLFLTAGALVSELGGVMSHGAVLAREFGLPAVVGVAGAIAALKTD